MGADQSLNHVEEAINENILSNTTTDDANPNSSTEQVPSTSSSSQNSHDGSRSSAIKRQLSRMGSLIVVNPGRQLSTEIEHDEMIIRLKQIPDFIPIVQNKDKISWTKEGEIARGRLDPTPLLNIGLLFQNELQESARLISHKQQDLTKQIKYIDRTSDELVKSFTERQKKFAKYADQINKINDISHSLTKCQSVLNDCKCTIQILNAMLPQEERLEPFVWSEDIELIEFKK